jgi:hypothetical protein
MQFVELAALTRTLKNGIIRILDGSPHGSSNEEASGV